MQAHAQHKLMEIPSVNFATTISFFYHLNPYSFIYKYPWAELPLQLQSYPDNAAHFSSYLPYPYNTHYSFFNQQKTSVIKLLKLKAALKELTDCIGRASWLPASPEASPSHPHTQ